MKIKHATYLMTLTVFALLLAIGVTAYSGNQLLQAKSDKLTDLKAQKQALATQKLALIRAKKDIEQYNELNTIAKTIVPQDKDQARTVREITQFAKETGIPLQQIKFQASTLGDKKQAAGLTQVAPVEGIKGVFVLPIEVISSPENPVRFESLIAFLNKLETNRRTAHVNVINIIPDQESPELISFKLSLNAYVKP